MKIRFYQNLNGARWVGFLIAIISCFILSNANVETQWIGWAIGCVSCSMWVYFGFKDKDTPRALMEVMYLLISMRALYNWIIGY
ncbi:MAG: hypothetical protein CMA64_06790 [Euryarchaeota archaeon]|nr:hypothetical protein [Euryarchaeota archaeon]